MLFTKINWRKLMSGAVVLGYAGLSHAFVIDTGNADLSMRWDNTLKYSAGIRVEDQTRNISTDPNTNDGDNNFDTGRLISNRIDLLSEFEVSYQRRLSFRVSYAGWYDDVYRGETDNNGVGAATSSSLGRPASKFPKQTRQLMGRDGEIQDMLVQLNTAVADRPLTLRFGQHAMFWGESLFFPTVGVSGGMAPLDAIKATSVPNTPARELLLPVRQTSGTFQLNDETSFEWFVQFEWEPTRIPPPGAYFSPVDFLPDLDGQALLIELAPGVFLPVPVIDDIDPDDKGQFGVAMRRYSEALDADLGFYFVNFHQKDPPNFNLNLVPNPGVGPPFIPVSLQPVYAEDIQIVATSYSGFHFGMNVAGEISYWHDAPLVSSPGSNLPGLPAFNGSSNPGYALSDQIHAQVSFIKTLVKTRYWDGGSVLGEFALTSVIDVTENEAAQAPGRNDTAYGLRVLAQPQWYQVLPGVDLTGRAGLGYNFKGVSSADGNFNGNGATKGGDVTLGVDFDYKKTWFGGVSYTNFFGSDSVSRLHNYVDRDFVSINIKRTF